MRLCLILICGAVLFLVGIGWGLPSRQIDSFLFSRLSPWQGGEITRLASESNLPAEQAADVSSNPLDRHEAIWINPTDTDRARIVRRYRLMSYQPDEFATFAALSQMKPGRAELDPRMYKYGGLWVYPLGGLLKLASAAGWVRLIPDSAYYLDHPEAFGRFYIVARLYSAMWGLWGAVAVFLLVRRICRSTTAATCAALCFMLMPVVVTAAHEAKPHLAGTALTLWAVLAGAKYVESGSRRMAVATAILCGAAIGMDPSALLAQLVLPVMLVLRNFPHAGCRALASPRIAELAGGFGALRSAIRLSSSKSRAVSGVLNLSLFRDMVGLLVLALLVYCITNPYVPINLVRNRALLRSEFSNSSDFYHASLSGFPRAILLMALGTSFLLALAGIFGAIGLGIRAAKVRSTSPQEQRRRAAGLLLAAAMMPVGIVFVVFAAGQPADYARFALPFDVFLAIEAVVAVETFVRSRRWHCASYGLLIATTAFIGVRYVIGFERDCRLQTSRTVAAARLEKLLSDGDNVLATREEPAPWSLPPVDVFRWKIVLPPRSWPADQPFDGAAVTVGPEDTSRHRSLRNLLLTTPISWANKPFRIQSAPSKRVGR